MTPAARRLAWLLVPAPPLSLAHLLAIRAHVVRPSFAPVVLLALLPLGVLVACIAGRGAPLRARVTLGLVAALELAWCLVAASAVGMAIGLSSG